MKPGLVATRCLAPIQFQKNDPIQFLFHGLARINPAWHSDPLFTSRSCYSSSLGHIICFTSEKKPRYCLLTLCSFSAPKSSDANCELATKNRIEGTLTSNLEPQHNGWRVEVGSPSAPSYVSAAKLSLSDQAFFLLAFIACMASVAFTSLLIATVPTLHDYFFIYYCTNTKLHFTDCTAPLCSCISPAVLSSVAMSRAATSLSKLTETAQEELPSTMAAIRLSGIELSDLTLELSDLSREVADGVRKSAEAVQAAEAGIRKVGSFVTQQTVAMIQERANLPIISLQPLVAGAAKKTSRAVGQTTKTFMNMISGQLWSENLNENRIGMEEYGQ